MIESQDTLKPQLDTSRICKNCDSVKESEFCNICRQDTTTIIHVFVSDTMKNPLEKIKGKIRECNNKSPHIEFTSCNSTSGEKIFLQGVDKFMTIDRMNNKYDQVIIDRQTKNIIHEEHTPLSEHHNKSKKI